MLGLMLQRRKARAMHGYFGTRRELLRLGSGAVAAGLAVGSFAPFGAGLPYVPEVARAQLVTPTPIAAWLTTARDQTGGRFLPDSLGPIQQRWRIVLRGGVPGTPAIAGDRVYAASFGGDIAAVERSTGITLWHHYVEPTAYRDRQLAFFAGPAVADDRLVVAGGIIACLDTTSGSTLWSHPAMVGDDLSYFWGAPIIVDGVVIAGSGSGTEQPPTPGRLRAYDLASGAERWRTNLVPDGGNGGGVLAPPTVDVASGLVYVTTGAPYQAVAGDNPGTSSLIALDLHSGSVVWQDQIARRQNFNSAAVLLDQRVFAANKTGFYAWDRVSRQQLWSTPVTQVPADDDTRFGPTIGPEGGPIATDGERLYVLSNDATTTEFVAAALSPYDGSVIWQQRFPGFTFAAPCVASDAVAISSADGTLRLLEPATGATQSEFSLGEGCACAPAMVSGALVVGTGSEPFLHGQALIGFTA